MRRFSSTDADFDARLAALLAFESAQDPQVDATVAAILADVKTRGDAAVLEYTQRFDRLSAKTLGELEIPKRELDAALKALPAAQRDALAAAANIALATDDPIAKIDDHIEALARDTGRMPNRLVIGLPLWNKLRNNAKVIARFPGAASVGVTMAQFASLLLNPSIDVRVGIMSQDTAKLGLAKHTVNIVGLQLVVFHATASPTLYDPSFMKTFRLRRGGVDVVRTYRDDSARSDILAVDWSEDIRVTSPVCARKLTAS